MSKDTKSEKSTVRKWWDDSVIDRSKRYGSAIGSTTKKWTTSVWSGMKTGASTTKSFATKAWDATTGVLTAPWRWYKNRGKKEPEGTVVATAPAVTDKTIPNTPKDNKPAVAVTEVALVKTPTTTKATKATRVSEVKPGTSKTSATETAATAK